VTDRLDGWNRRLLHIDSGGALIAGVLMLVLASWLSSVYRLQQSGVVAMGIANLLYGTYSGLLARRRIRPLTLIVVLVAANAAWAVVCWVSAVRVAGSASWLGIAHLVGEGVYVATLAVLEWRSRAVLLRA
jgi:hypothetical protein